MYETLLEKAKQARLRAHAPYSHFNVGAAVLTGSGAIFEGCNIENSSYGATVCAEQIAIFHAYTHGERDIEAITIVADSPAPCPPCGICRQVIMDLAGDVVIIYANLQGETQQVKASDLLPAAFTDEFL